MIIATRGRPLDLRWALLSVAYQSLLPHEVIVVDSSSQAEFTANEDSTRELSSVTQVKHLSAPPGLTKQRNIGVEQAVGEIILFIDDDVVLSPNYIERLLAGFDRYPHALGLTGSTLLEQPPGPLLSRFRRILGFRDFRTGEPTWLGEVGYIKSPSHDAQLHVLPGCNMAFRREVFDFLALRFDERLEGYGLAEDYIFTSQVRRYGALVQLESALLFHNALQRNRWSPEYAIAQVANIAQLGRLTKMQFGVNTPALVARIVLRGLRGTIRLGMRGQYPAAVQVALATIATVRGRPVRATVEGD